MAPETNGYKQSKHKKTTYGTGLLKGLGITLRHLVTPAVTMEYPDVHDTLPPRSRGVIALKTENCTVCMLCARECPDWCIYIEGHKEAREPAAEGKRAKKFNVLDRFAIDYALCMYCGICVEVCPYDALFWSPEFEYSTTDVVELTHEQERLNEWMYSVLPPPPLDEGAQGPELKVAPAPPPSAAQAPAAADRKEGGSVPAVESGGPAAQAPTTTPAPAPVLEGEPEAAGPEPEPMFDPQLV
ncbi:MAG: NuoI/complex I 23 kDa subunit family protein, partial [Actinomycetota bacterium]